LYFNKYWRLLVRASLVQQGRRLIHLRHKHEVGRNLILEGRGLIYIIPHLLFSALSAIFLVMYVASSTTFDENWNTVCTREHDEFSEWEKLLLCAV